MGTTCWIWITISNYYFFPSASFFPSALLPFVPFFKNILLALTNAASQEHPPKQTGHIGPVQSWVSGSCGLAYKISAEVASAQRTLSSLSFALPCRQGKMWTQVKTHLLRFQHLSLCVCVCKGKEEEEKGREKILFSRVEGFLKEAAMEQINLLLLLN